MTIDRFFKGERLIVIPKKEKAKILVFNKLIESFTKDTNYTEKEVNQLLNMHYDDYAILRRYLVDYKLLARDKYGTLYKRV